jgi:hypothetical protein
VEQEQLVQEQMALVAAGAVLQVMAQMLQGLLAVTVDLAAVVVVRVVLLQAQVAQEFFTYSTKEQL